VLAAAGAGLARGEVVAVHADALRGERFVQLVEGLGDGLVRGVGPVRRLSLDELEALGTGDSAVASGRAVERLAVAASPTPVAERAVCTPQAADLRRVAGWLAAGPVPLATWEPDYGRLAEAQVQWEQRHGRPLDRPA
jgi:tRNA threonylcarbamoyladenosine biosynthesis protein TsaB